MGEVSWALTRGSLYAIAFLVVMLLLGLVLSPLGILMIPGALLIGLAAAAVGMAATTYMRSWKDFDVITVVTMPMFLFSGTFFPLENLPPWARSLAEIFPLTHLVRLSRSFSLGSMDGSLLWGAAYLLLFSLVCYPLALLLMRRRLVK